MKKENYRYKVPHIDQDDKLAFSKSLPNLKFGNRCV